MSARLYREAFQNKIQSSFEPDRPNKFQTWLTDVFVKDTKPFYVVVDGKKVEVNRLRVAAKALEVGQFYKEEHKTSQIPQGFFRSYVIPAVKADFEC